MRRVPLLSVFVAAVVLVLAGCGGGRDSDDQTPTASASNPAASTAGSKSVSSDLDKGPRAGESPYDEAKAKVGESLFKDKGCSACHAFGKRVTGPDLAGVTMRRTAAWMESQILHPEIMVKQDPIARQLFAQYALQMPNQGLTPDQARAIIEYLKHQDHEAGEDKEEHK